jgi:mono/diheme cytochrome c family protein
LFLLTFTITACGSGDPSAGATVYADNCASCHAADGTGGIGPDLTQEIESGEEAELESLIRAGAGTMPSFEATLSSEEISDVVAFLVDEWG